MWTNEQINALVSQVINRLRVRLVSAPVCKEDTTRLLTLYTLLAKLVVIVYIIIQISLIYCDENNLF